MDGFKQPSTRRLTEHSNQAPASQSASIAFYASLFVAVAVGAGLRLSGISQQLLISDEWHALHNIATASYWKLWGLLTYWGTSIPLNLYYKLLLQTVGWSEWTLRLPSLLAGITLVAVFPLLFRRLLDRRAIVFATFLLSVSPFLILYSRYARPYSLVALLSLVAIVSVYRWAVSGRLAHAVLFIGAAVVSAWVHVLEIRTIVVLLAFLFGVKMLDVYRERGTAREPIVVSLGGIVMVTLAVGGLIAAFLLPVFLQGFGRFAELLQSDRPTLATLRGTLELLSGTASPVAVFSIVTLAVVGMVTLWRRLRLFAMLLVAVIVGDVASVVIPRPVDSGIAVVMARYLIPLFPVFAVLVAVGADSALERLERLPRRRRPIVRVMANILAAALLVGLTMLGPLPWVYRGTSNFTNHKVYQFSYQRGLDDNARFQLYRAVVDKTRTNSQPRPAMSRFYERLAEDPEAEAIIEYPVLIGDRFIPYQIYQRVHHKRVFGGYLLVPESENSEIRHVVAYADWPVGFVLGQLEDPSKSRFQSYVDLDDLPAVRESGAKYLVVHFNLARELAERTLPKNRRASFDEAFVRKYGPPIFTDNWVAVFSLLPPRGEIRSER